MTRRLPMFPLGTALVPHAPLPLQVFEPRYRAMLDDVLAADGRFGTVLIERGTEVGGGDQRTAIGTVAAIARVEELPAQGVIAVMAVGTAARIDVVAGKRLGRKQGPAESLASLARREEDAVLRYRNDEATPRAASMAGGEGREVLARRAQGL